MIIELFAAAQCLVAEGPRWCAAENALYWVDISAGCVLRKKAGTSPDAFERFDPKLGKIGAFAFGKDGKLLLFTERCEIHEAVFGGKPVLKWTLPGHAATRFNDVFDAGGGVYFCGVAPIRPDVRGELWRFDAVTGTFDCIEPTTDGMPNGMGLSPDGKTFYFCSDFAGEGVPDGMCVDPADGTLWVAVWGGHRLEHRAPDGRLLESIPFKAEKVSSATVAGGVIYVTTANLPFDKAAFESQNAGCVFALRKKD